MKKQNVLFILNDLPLADQYVFDFVKEWFNGFGLEWNYKILNTNYPFKVVKGQRAGLPIQYFIDLQDLKSFIENQNIKDGEYTSIFVLYNQQNYPSDWPMFAFGYSWVLRSAPTGEIPINHSIVGINIVKHEYLHSLSYQIRGWKDELHEYQDKYGENRGMEEYLKLLIELDKKTQNTPPTSPGSPESDFFADKGKLYLNYKQNDPKWGNIPLRGTKLLIKDWGCALVSVCNVLNKFNIAINPAQLNEKIDYVNGLIVWSSVSKLYPNIKLVNAIDYSKIPANLLYIRKILDNGVPIVAETRVGFFRNKSHFLTIWGYDGYYKKFTMSDPLSDKIYFDDKYGNPSRYIYSIKVYNKV